MDEVTVPIDYEKITREGSIRICQFLRVIYDMDMCRNMYVRRFETDLDNAEIRTLRRICFGIVRRMSRP